MLRFSSYSASIKCDSDSADNKLTKSPNSSAGSPLPTPVVLDDVGVGHPMDSFIESSKVNENCNDRETLAPPISSSSTLASTPEHAPMLSPVKRTLPLSDISPRSMLKDPDSMTALARVIQRVTEERLGLCKVSFMYDQLKATSMAVAITTNVVTVVMIANAAVLLSL